MQRKILAMLAVVSLFSSLLAAATPTLASPPAPGYDVLDIGPVLRAWEPSLDLIAGPTPSGVVSGAGSGEEGDVSASAAVGDVEWWLGLDSYCGFYYSKPYELRAVGTSAEVWVALDLGYTIPPGTYICQDKPSDPRPTPVITDEQVQYILAEFDNNIYPIDTDFFGSPDYHDGTNNLFGDPAYYGDKVAIMIDNVRDDQWYDPGYPLYIAGFYSPSYEFFFDRNMITIDAKEWEIRTGPGVEHPYLYEGVVAHELQHLLHDDADADEELFVNEGCSDFAEFICGYAPALSGHIEDTAAYPENSLVVWEDQGGLEIRSDYGHAYFWTLYLYEQFGGPFVQAMVYNPENGISGINSTLNAFNIQKDFADLYHDWAVALLIDSKTPGGGRYEFDNEDFNLDIGTPDAPNPEAYDMPGAPPWGTDYIWIDGNPKDLAKLTFNGIDYTTFPTAWSSDGGVLWSGTGNLIDNWAIFEATGGGTLTFDTYYDIEDYWDFGFVQVSTDGGYTWTSLENAYTTYDHDPSAHPKVIENLPGLTGWSEDWVTMSFDLSAYAGQNILIAFRYVTDWGTLFEGWYIDNVYVDGTLISDGSSTDPFKDITEVLPINNNFTVTFVGIKEKGNGNQYKVLTMKLADMSEEGLFELNSVLKSSDKAVMLVTFDAPEGFTGYADYTHDFTYTNAGPKK